jgi:hypothetical protein
VFIIIQNVNQYGYTTFLQIADDVMIRSKDEVWLNMFVADCRSIQEFVRNKALMMAKELLKLMLEAAFVKNTEICKKFQTMSDILTMYSTNLLLCTNYIY